jgi:hypothetical protein
LRRPVTAETVVRVLAVALVLAVIRRPVIRLTRVRLTTIWLATVRLATVGLWVDASLRVKTRLRVAIGVTAGWRLEWGPVLATGKLRLRAVLVRRRTELGIDGWLRRGRWPVRGRLLTRTRFAGLRLRAALAASSALTHESAFPPFSRPPDSA